MRASAEVNKVGSVLEVDLEVFLPLRTLDDVDLVGSSRSVKRAMASARGSRHGDAILLGNDRLHLLFDALEVGVGDRRVELDVVVEAVCDGGSDSELRAWKSSRVARARTCAAMV